MVLQEARLVCLEDQHRAFYHIRLEQDEATRFFRVVQEHGRIGQRPVRVSLPRANPDFLFLDKAVALYHEKIREKLHGRKRAYKPEAGEGSS